MSSVASSSSNGTLPLPCISGALVDLGCCHGSRTVVPVVLLRTSAFYDFSFQLASGLPVAFKLPLALRLALPLRVAVIYRQSLSQ